MAGRFEWTGPYKSRSYLYHELAEMARGTTYRVASEVAGRARSNLAAQNHYIRIVPHTPFHIEVESATGKNSVGSWLVSLVGDNPAALEYGHAPSGAFGPHGRYSNTKSKAPAGTYVLHRAADLPGKATYPRDHRRANPGGR